MLVRNFGDDIIHQSIVDAHASAKGIKCDSSIAVNGGKLEVLVFGNGERCEGIESKDNIIIGGDASVYAYATNDAINCGNNFIMNSGKVYAYSASNDGNDSNGKITVNGGLLVANGCGTPEQGVDCDFDSNYNVTGGTIVSIGGIMGRSPNVPRGEQTTQPAVAWSGIELTRDKYMTLCDEDGRLLLSYKLPRTIEKGAAVISTPMLAEGNGYMLTMSDTLIDGSSLGCGVYVSGECTTDAAINVALAGIVTNVDAEGKSETLGIDTTKFRPGIMPPPPPGFGPNNLPDNIKEKFRPGAGTFPPPPPARMSDRRDEGYNVTNLPGGGW